MQLETRHWKLWAVVLVHLAVGAMAVLLSPQMPPSLQLSVWLVITISQAGLLSVVVGLGPFRRTARIAWLVLGCIYLAILTDSFLPGSVPAVGRAMYVALAIAPVFVVSLLLSIVRKLRAHMAFVGSDARNDTKPGLQFSIKHFLMLDVLLGLLLGLRPPSFEPTMSNSMILLAIIAVCAAALILGVVWASLSPGRPWPRIAVVLLLAVLAGFLPPYYVRMSGADQIAFISVSFIQAFIMIVSLLVVRSTGYRLVVNDTELPTNESLST